MACAPFVNYLSKRFNFKVPLVIGVIVLVLAQIFAGLSHRIWELFLTQGVMFGIGLGFVSHMSAFSRVLASKIIFAHSCGYPRFLSPTNGSLVNVLWLE